MGKVLEMRKTILSESDVAEIVSKYQDGKSFDFLAREYKISPRRVKDILVDHGIKSHPKHRFKKGNTFRRTYKIQFTSVFPFESGYHGFYKDPNDIENCPFYFAVCQEIKPLNRGCCFKCERRLANDVA